MICYCELTSEFFVHHNQKLGMIDSFEVLYEYVIFENLWKFFHVLQNLVKISTFLQVTKVVTKHLKDNTRQSFALN